MSNGVTIILFGMLTMGLFLALSGSLANDSYTFHYSNYQNETNYTNATAEFGEVPHSLNPFTYLSFLKSMINAVPNIPGLNSFISVFVIVVVFAGALVIIRGVS